MPAPSFCTWDGGTGEDGVELPRRPSADDLGGDQKQDNYENPPDDLEHFTAAGWNQLVKQVRAMAKVMPACLLEVGFSSGAPFVVFSSARSDLTAATFTVTHNGTGDTSITWPANTFPAPVIKPSGLTLISNASAVVDAHVEVLTNGIRVRTRSGGSATDVPFTTHIN